MDQSDLLKLVNASHLTVAELREREPELWRRLEATFSETVRARAVNVVDPRHEEVRKRIERVDFTRASKADVASRLRDALSDVAGENGPEIADRVAAAMATEFHPETRVTEHTDLMPLVQKGRLLRAIGMSGVDARTVERVSTAVDSIDRLTDTVLTELLADRKVTEQEAKAIGAAATLFQLADEDPSVAAIIRAMAGDDLAEVDWTRRLAGVPAAGWADVIRENRMAIPDGTTADQLADALAKRFTALHSEQVFIGNLPSVDAADVAKRTELLTALLPQNPNVFSVDSATLDLSELAEPQQHAAKAAHAHLQSMVRAYPGLRLDEVLSDPGQSPDAKARMVDRRISLIHAVQQRLDAETLLKLDYSPGSDDIARLGLDQTAAPEERKLVVETLKSYQRSFAIAGTPEIAQTLVAAGYSSAVSIAKDNYDHFQATVGSDELEHVWRDARAMLMDTSATTWSFVDLVAGGFDKSPSLGNVSPSTNDYLRKLDGFESLFGSLAFCACDHCQSILSPAAYFVDLMHFVAENIEPQFAGHDPQHALKLKTRRADLWSLELTCANTNDRIPTLQIVAEILENFIARRAGHAGPLSDRAAIDDLVYRQTLPTAINSFRQPFHLPLARANAYLQKFESSRADIARTLHASAAAIASAELWLSREERALITTVEHGEAVLNRLYQLTFTAQGAGFAPVDAQVLVAAMAITRDELGAVVESTFVRAAGAQVTIQAEKRGPDSIQNDIEHVHGLTADALDRMHRFVRLWRHVPWSIAEFDRFLGAINETTLDAAGVIRVANARQVQRRLQIPVDETAALVGAIPQAPARTSLLDRLFNPPNAAPADALPSAARFVHPALRRNSAVPGDPMLPRLLAGLGIDLTALAALVRGLATPLGLDAAAADDADRFFVLTAQNLSVLYRHARLARALRLTIDELLRTMRVAGLGANGVASGVDVLAVINADDWRRSSGYSLDDIAVATGTQPRDPSRYVDAEATAAAVAETATESLRFGPTMLSVALGVTEQASRDLLHANAVSVEFVDGKWQLVSGVDLEAAAFDIPATATVPVPPDGSRAVTAADLRAAFGVYEPSAVLARALGAAFGLERDKVRALARLAGEALNAASVVRAIRREGPIDPLRQLIERLRPLAVAFKAKEWDAEAIDFARQHAARFAMNPPNLTVDSLTALSVYARIAGTTLGTGPDATQVDAADIRAVITAFLPAAGADAANFPLDQNDAVARIVGASPGLVRALRGRMTLPDVAVSALDIVGRAARLASTLGIDGESFAALSGDDYAGISRGADALQSAWGARFATDAERRTQLDLLAEPIREQKRDALVAWLIHSLQPRIFFEPDDLYNYFLIDAEAGGCSTTSRVVAAISSVQLYIHRIIMNLEQNDPAAADPLALKMPEAAAAEWTWRKNYRVFEANRKVFLWPENYIEPDLRDDKTPEFKELENELLQTALSEEDVLNAYTKYLKQFEELASLTIAGAYQEVDAKRGVDVLHLFGAATTDPAVFYYRTCENISAGRRDPRRTPIWTPWRKIDVQITARRVSPVVYRARLHLFWTDVKTRPFNTVQGGSSEFAGYRHTMTMRYTTLRPDGTWTAPQTVELPRDGWFGPGRGIIEDPLWGGSASLDNRTHTEPIDDYTLAGPNWETVSLTPVTTASGDVVLTVRYRNFMEQGNVDLFRRRVTRPSGERGPTPHPNLLNAKNNQLFYGAPVWWFSWTADAMAQVVAEEQRMAIVQRESSLWLALMNTGLYAEAIADLRSGTEFTVVAGSPEDSILQVGTDVILLQGSVTDDDDYVLHRIGTTLADDVAYRLFVGGVDGLLDIETQKVLQEAGIPLTPVGGRIDDRSNAGTLDFKGPYGVYYRELFFHLPFLIANALNARGQFASAQGWYHYIFDPTATEVITVPAGTPPAERAHRLLDRVWRYREFRNLDQVRLREILTDPEALAVYRKDPFNPHAIARLRLSAYQKSIVMKYVDNLLDWADMLFTQFTMESVNEALMLYTMASDVLGPRPARLGDCGEGAVQPKDYEHISPTLSDNEEILIEVETMIVADRVRKHPTKRRGRFTKDRTTINRARRGAALFPDANKRAVADGAGGGRRGAAGAERDPSAILSVRGESAEETRSTALSDAVVRIDAGEAPPIFRGAWKETRIDGWGPSRGSSTTPDTGTTSDLVGRARDLIRPRGPSKARKPQRGSDHSGRHRNSDKFGRFGWSVVRQASPVFCVPVNTELLAYWDRVDDRLYKIRHCQDITGEKRELALFAPEIDPRLLVRMRAAGLTLEDVLGATSGDLPPYRFLFLIDRAKAYAATLSSFGAALLSSIERKDGEELNRLRIVQQQNLTRMTTQLRRWEIAAAEEAITTLERQLDAANYRSQYYDELANQYRNSNESAESTLRHVVSGIRAIDAALEMVAGATALVPQVGSPFAMKWGGAELEKSLHRFGTSSKAGAEGLQAVASSLSLEAGYERRAEGWRHQKELAGHDIRQLERQLTAAKFRLEIGNRSLEMHEKGIEHLDEILEFTDGKFSNFGLYTWLSTQLRRLHRGAYQNALALARLTEQAFRFERGEDTSAGLAATYWDAQRSGLIAGEQLLIDLQNLERRYLETNVRNLEVDQPFALSQLDPAALIELRATGECTFAIDELLFDIVYPGQYKRRIRGVRVTIPCITGPYVNVGATLTLQRSWMRTSAALAAPLTEIPPRRSVSVATSTAQNDAGVFELSFRDERYMPFEGAGAVSEWALKLPKTFRQFDYDTITDVILSISYTSDQDGALRDRVETDNGALDRTITKFLADNAVGRVFSLRQDFSSAFSRLLHSPAGTNVPIEITSRHFPIFVGNRAINVTRSAMVLRMAAGAAPGGFSLAIDGAGVSAFAADPTLGNLPAKALPAGFTNNVRAQHVLRLDAAGGLAPAAPPAGDVSPLDAERLLDVLLYVEFTVTP